MYDMNRRLNTIEKTLRTGKHSELIPPPPMAVLSSGRDITPEDERKLGLPETWITCKQQLQAQERANIEFLQQKPGCLPKAITIELDVGKEYQARQ